MELTEKDVAESESTTSQDVADECVDSRSRLTSLRSVAKALLSRIKFLEETAAFSLINVGLSLVAFEMAVEAGDDRMLNGGEPARFRAPLCSKANR